MNYELTGKLFDKSETQQISDSFKKREFVVEKSENNFTEHIKFQLTQDRCSLLDNYNINDEVKVHFNIRGRKWEKDGKVSYFTNLEAWRLENQSSNPVANQSDSSISEEMPSAEGEDDLPF